MKGWRDVRAEERARVHEEASDILVKPAYQFVLNEQKRWLSMGNTKETGRYAILRQYFEERLPLWGLAAST